MKNRLLTLTFLLTSFFTYAQRYTETFFKDFELTKKTTEKNAKYKEIYSEDEDSVVFIQAINLKKNCLISEKYFKNKTPIGIWTYYNKNCTIINKKDFSKLVYSDKIIDTIFYNNNLKYDEHYQVAEFPGGKLALDEFLHTKMKFPIELVDERFIGGVSLQYMIKADGTIKMVSIRTSMHPLFDLEAWELFERMPKWIPAKKDGKPIDSMGTYILIYDFD
ncbi:MAG: energy transducer TonB [Chitinophagaceae bacterium]